MKSNKLLILGALLALALVIFFIFAPNLRTSAPEGGTGASSETSAAASDESAAGAASNASESTEPARGTKENPYKVGILQLMSHPSLDQIHQGLIDRLAEKGYVNGENIQITDLNGQGEQSNLKMMSDQLVAEKSDIVVGIATPSAQALATAAQDQIPVILSAVTDPVGAGLVNSMDAPGRPITGTSDALPVKNQIDLLFQLVPDAKKIGLLYTTSEPASAAQIAEAEAAVAERGLESVKASIATTNDLAQVAEQLATEVDAIYVPNDNTIAGAMNTLIPATDSQNVPVIVSAEAMVAQGGLASMGVVQYQIGVDTADMVIAVLEGQDPASMPVKLSIESEIYLNVKQAEKLGISIPAEIQSKMKDVSAN